METPCTRGSYNSLQALAIPGDSTKSPASCATPACSARFQATAGDGKLWTKEPEPGLSRTCAQPCVFPSGMHLSALRHGNCLARSAARLRSSETDTLRHCVLLLLSVLSAAWFCGSLELRQTAQLRESLRQREDRSNFVHPAPS